MPQPSRDELWRIREVAMADYAREVDNNIKISKAVSLARFGTRLVPIPVPLQPNETRLQFELRFQTWLFRERNRTMQRVLANANVERSCRVAFARAEARAFLLVKVKEEDAIKAEPGVVVQNEDRTMDEPTRTVRIKRERHEGDEDEDVRTRRQKMRTDHEAIDLTVSPPQFDADAASAAASPDDDGRPLTEPIQQEATATVVNEDQDIRHADRVASVAPDEDEVDFALLQSPA